MSMDTMFDNYKIFLDKIDRFWAESAAALGEDLVCRKGCGSCCRHLNLFPVEAVHIRLAMEELEPEIVAMIRQRAENLYNDPDGECPLLYENTCLLYPVRPVICRTHGLPVLVRDPDGHRVDVCPLNFTSGRRPEKDHILDIEQLNTTLAAVNALFTASAFEPGDVPDRLLLAHALLMDLD